MLHDFSFFDGGLGAWLRSATCVLFAAVIVFAPAHSRQPTSNSIRGNVILRVPCVAITALCIDP
jgi:hypothetical protein